MKENAEKMVGQTYSYLTVQSWERRDKRTWCFCKCICGNKLWRRQDHLRKPTVQSCGCRQHETFHKQENNGQWTGYQEISGHYFAQLKRRKDLEFNITIKEIWELYEKQGRRCALTGVPIVFSSLHYRRKGIPQTASLDRIDSSRGYIIENIQWVHKDINQMKNDFSQERFIEICHLVKENAL